MSLSLLKQCFVCNRERGGVHSVGAADWVYNGCGGMLALGQLLVAGARGHTGGRLTHSGGRVHARVAPALRGGGTGARYRGLAVAGAAAAAARAAPHAAARSSPLLPRCLQLPNPAVHTACTATTSAENSPFLTGVPRALLSCA